ncbi:MAG: hypothetical protein V3U92_04265 [Cellulophaga sp.]
MTKKESLLKATADRVVVGVIENEPCILGTKNGQFMFFRIHKAVSNHGAYALNISQIDVFLEKILTQNENNKIASFEESEWKLAFLWLLEAIPE